MRLAHQRTSEHQKGVCLAHRLDIRWTTPNPPDIQTATWHVCAPTCGGRVRYYAAVWVWWCFSIGVGVYVSVYFHLYPIVLHKITAIGRQSSSDTKESVHEMCARRWVTNTYHRSTNTSNESAFRRRSMIIKAMNGYCLPSNLRSLERCTRFSFYETGSEGKRCCEKINSVQCVWKSGVQVIVL